MRELKRYIMRELKFKLWNKDHQKWYNPDYLDVTDDGVIFCNDGYDGTQIEICQYTGLKDKNGKEIYEGDIIQFTFYLGISSNRKIIKNYEVYWADGNAGFALLFLQDKEETCDFQLIQNSEASVIIGNKFENPELL
jgi:uncharacterized phage protein (TIGR01671 family)